MSQAFFYYFTPANEMSPRKLRWWALEPRPLLSVLPVHVELFRKDDFVSVWSLQTHKACSVYGLRVECVDVNYGDIGWDRIRGKSSSVRPRIHIGYREWECRTRNSETESLVWEGQRLCTAIVNSMKIDGWEWQDRQFNFTVLFFGLVTGLFSLLPKAQRPNA